ncbi:hypothetical protein [Alicyclobacillus acidoterrestris]|uniref:Uncharacterized protein n=1 Tax=Alicyclobacillus acidoterrestris (strain ATCC 49025 / DSM 3922 / CIP 106132 / NCIMB 13137 / GD3B) TaxID=1356854 RepID=T0CPM8_ALIAG|nr:hypothetical protein [Alicyclobacillus acidoterrestris]EPZ41437.1 hypothetical protein N007_17115 [Alicyclobacillus acidoterrestris ATCC 49025]UNO47748.1 hypothetical protein K1I37_13750 [Alicyclobacillus acidoterrestris]GEO27575.1 hypothetical protein AAC03nite_33600 [Alicyclobacillus acidoterrestris]
MQPTATYSEQYANCRIDGQIPAGGWNGFKMQFTIHEGIRSGEDEANSDSVKTIFLTLTNIAAVYLTMRDSSTEPYDWLWQRGCRLIEEALSESAPGNSLEERDYYILLDDVKHWSNVKLRQLSPSPRPSARMA